jgi:S-adenosylmethionine hydrolase
MAIITLTSDIGDQDFLTGAIKGQLLSQLQDTQIIGGKAIHGHHPNFKGAN